MISAEQMLEWLENHAQYDLTITKAHSGRVHLDWFENDKEKQSTGSGLVQAIVNAIIHND